MNISDSQHIDRLPYSLDDQFTIMGLRKNDQGEIECHVIRKDGGTFWIHLDQVKYLRWMEFNF